MVQKFLFKLRHTDQKGRLWGKNSKAETLASSRQPSLEAVSPRVSDTASLILHFRRLSMRMVQAHVLPALYEIRMCFFKNKNFTAITLNVLYLSMSMMITVIK